MKRTRFSPVLEEIPSEFHPLFRNAAIYDSSCSPEAQVFYIDREGGYFLKRGEKGSLLREAAMARYFHALGLTAPVLAYRSQEGEAFDWLLTERVRGEDATAACYLADPRRLADTMGELLRALHERSGEGCPVPNRMEEYFATVEANYRRGQFDLSYGEQATQEEAYRVAMEGKGALKSDTLLHGDFCLPNFLMENWRFRGFVDLGNGGIGDRHVDLYWGAWTLRYNLKTDQYRQRFFDAYGKDRIDLDALTIVGAAECFG